MYVDKLYSYLMFTGLINLCSAFRICIVWPRPISNPLRYIVVYLFIDLRIIQPFSFRPPSPILTKAQHLPCRLPALTLPPLPLPPPHTPPPPSPPHPPIRSLHWSLYLRSHRVSLRFVCRINVPSLPCRNPTELWPTLNHVKFGKWEARVFVDLFFFFWFLCSRCVLTP